MRKCLYWKELIKTQLVCKYKEALTLDLKQQQQCHLKHIVSLLKLRNIMKLPVLFLLIVETASANTINLALTGEATQIDTYDELGAASNAIDGNRNSNYYHDSCTHTATTTNPWWRVDLQESNTVTSITITNRGDCCGHRLDGAEIRVGNSLDNNGNNNQLVATISRIRQGSSENFIIPPTEGRYVNVFLRGTDKYLTLCEVEVYGEADAKVNVALAKEATQSSTMHAEGLAGHAVDGKRDPLYYHGSCTHTLLSTDPWWRVDLKHPYFVTSIIITNRKECCAQRLDGAEIRVGNSLDNNGNSNQLVATVSHIPAGRSKTFILDGAVEGQYVNVLIPGTDKYLTLCEVEVYGYQQEGAPPEEADERPV
ncbi:uncharacterized protein LOC110170159 [Boleophthalmus pectinirostris]|uniref:uncharacterized protein LOC110170159 n=1 Tax=Boleophthalmus pectinirostris TaxID=150288 RepID=UPI0024318E81|nr:uncharacterized protein LOC110170159 [Boleophthalmus pectinirostris]XP_055020147.1 uncharacterized protein LOC110170159 [Boleophthalmus pectinirostris]